MFINILALCMFSATQALTAFPIDSLPTHKLIYKIKGSDETNKIFSGYLAGITDTELWYGAQIISASKMPGVGTAIPYTNLETLTVHRKGAAGRTALHGALIGIGGGALAGLIEGDDPDNYWFSFSAGDKALAYGFLLGATGAIIGLILGAVVRKKFSIGGNKEKFDSMRYNLLR